MGMELTAGDEAGLFTHFVKAELPAWFTEKTEAEQEAWIDAGGDVTKLDPDFEAKVAAYMRKTRVGDADPRVRSWWGRPASSRCRRRRRSGSPLLMRSLLCCRILRSWRAGSRSRSLRICRRFCGLGRKFGFHDHWCGAEPFERSGESAGSVQIIFTGFRLASKTATDIIFGSGAWDAGAHCPQIPRWMQGTCYTGNDFAPAEEDDVEVSMDEEFDMVIRIRVCCVTDEHIRMLARDDVELAA